MDTHRADSVRGKLSSVSRTVSRLHLSIAKLLLEVQRRKYWLAWGFDSFADYVEAEADFSIRWAQELTKTYRRFVVDLKVHPKLMRRVSWSKAALLTAVTTESNLDTVFADLRTLPYSELKRKYRVTSSSSKSPPGLALNPRQRAVFQDALDLAKAKTGSTNDTTNFMTIITDFLHTTETPTEAHGEFLGTVAPSTPVHVWSYPRPDEHEFYVEPDVWEQLCYAIHDGKPALLTGPTGSGKSELCEMASGAAARQFQAFNFGGSTDARSTLVGNTHFDKERGTWFCESPFIRAVQTSGTTILLDELSRCDGDASNLLLTITDRQGYLRVDEAEDSPVVCRADDIAFLATANLGAGYRHAEELDLALKDRFETVIAIDFPPPEHEVNVLLKRCPGLKKATAKLLVKLATRQREMARDGEFIAMVSTRSLIAAASQVAAGISPQNAVKFCLVNQFNDEGGDLSERARMTQICQRFLVFPKDAK